MYKLLSFFCLSFVVIGINSHPAPSFIKPCHMNDKECLKASAQAALPHFASGIPDLGVPSIDPLVLDDVKVNDLGLSLVFKQMHVTRIKDCQFVDIEFTSDKSLSFDVECPIVATGKYTMTGNLSVVPIEGDGDFEIKTEKVKLSAKVDLEKKKGDDGEDYINIVNLDKSYELEEQVFFKFVNLFNGDEEKAKPINDILEISWKEVTLGLGKPVIHEIIDKAKDIIGLFFKAVPAKELILN